MKNLSDQFDRDYFENGIAAGVSCYTNYRWLPELTVPMARAIARHMLLTREELVLDFGCAKGYLVKALRQDGFLAYGADISPYAISQADEGVRNLLSLVAPGEVPRGSWDCIIAKDVLEHATEDDLPNILRAFHRSGARLFVVVPLGDGNGRYVIPEMEKDVTHRIRQPAEWWAHRIYEAGYSFVWTDYALPGIKENWTTRYPEGNGFFTAQ